MSTFRLEIITPVGKKFEQDIEFILIRTTEGDMGILPGHAPFVSGTQPGEIKIRLEKNKEVRYYISGGFLSINLNKVILIVDEAMLPEEIDIIQAKKEVEYAKEKLKKLNEDKQIIMAQKSLQDALMKVSVAEKFL